MDQPEEELEQITSWFNEEGLAPESPKEAQLSLLWRALQSTRSHLSSVTWDLDTQRSQHLSEMAEVRKSLEQIRIFTEHKDVLAQEIQDENDRLKDQMRRMISLQDSQISEVAKMLYQQGLTELIHSSPSEQVAYLLVERASLLDTSVAPDKLTVDGNAAGRLGTEDQMLNTSPHQTEASLHVAGQTSGAERECSRLERDLEEGSRRLAMAHNEIRRLTDELEAAHLTQRAYEPELQVAQQEVECLRQEVGKLKKYEMVELRKAKEMNDRLDLEIRALRKRVRCLDAEKRSLQQTVVSLEEKLERRESVLQEQQAEQQLLPECQANQDDTSSKSQASDLMQFKEICRDLQAKLSAQSRCLSKKESEIHSLKQQLDRSGKDLENLIRTICTKESKRQDEKLWKINSLHCENTQCQLKGTFAAEDKEQQTQMDLLQNKDKTLYKESPDYQDAVNTVLANQEKCETLKEEICETLICLDKERSKNHEMKEKHKAKLSRAKQKFDDETSWRDERIKNLERELSLCSHSLAKEKELTVSITVENDKLLVERRRLLQQLNEEEHNKKDSNRTASLSKCRLDCLETENKKLRNKILNMSKQLAVLEYSLQNTKSVQCVEAPGTVGRHQATKDRDELSVRGDTSVIWELCHHFGFADGVRDKYRRLILEEHADMYHYVGARVLTLYINSGEMWNLASYV